MRYSVSSIPLDELADDSAPIARADALGYARDRLQGSAPSGPGHGEWQELPTVPAQIAHVAVDLALPW